ncbi:histone H2A [Perkinsela sp. CCAP 1560/4]|nr:histone H2A [Perkinsela sp. CCAP 1560/4]|eukprot:KNH03747.1 histone H2A [Perkinsela sp. CCAP 1560/4]
MRMISPVFATTHSMTSSAPTEKNPTPKQSGSISKKAGLIFPVGRIRSMLKKGRYTKRVAASAPVYLAAVLEYLTAELLELSGKVAVQQNRKRITPRAVTLAARTDEELSQLLGNVTFTQGGVMPSLHETLQKKGRLSQSGSC